MVLPWRYPLKEYTLRQTRRGSELVAAGSFTEGGGVPLEQIGGWNGGTWAPLGTGVGGYSPTIHALAVHDGYLVAGGEFTEAGGATASRIARWDGITWSALGTGIDGAVLAMTVFQGDLIVGGNFSWAGDDFAYNLARWDGDSWSPISTWVNAPVKALGTYGNELVAGGDFTWADGPAERVAKWDGTSWTALGPGMDAAVNALREYAGLLYASGEFSRAGGDSAHHIAAWDGVTWTALGSGTNDNCAALVVYGGSLYVGGSFTASGAPSLRIGRWDNLPVSVPGIAVATAASQGQLGASSPNPFVSHTTIPFALTEASQVRVLVTDVHGRVLRTLWNGVRRGGRQALVWDGRSETGQEVASGIYFCLMDVAGQRFSRKVVRTR